MIKYFPNYSKYISSWGIGSISTPTFSSITFLIKILFQNLLFHTNLLHYLNFHNYQLPNHQQQHILNIHLLNYLFTHPHQHHPTLNLHHELRYHRHEGQVQGGAWSLPEGWRTLDRDPEEHVHELGQPAAPRLWPDRLRLRERLRRRRPLVCPGGSAPVAQDRPGDQETAKPAPVAGERDACPQGHR